MKHRSNTLVKRDKGALVTNLRDGLIPWLKKADEIWVATALINQVGLNFITSSIRKDCQQHYLVGIDLPSEPKALITLYEGYLRGSLHVKVFSDKKYYYHPKVYVIRVGKSLRAFVGSANCTQGGLEKNIELTIEIGDLNQCQRIQDWFFVKFRGGKVLTSKFLREYQKNYAKRIKRRREDKKLVAEDKNSLIRGNEEFHLNKEKLLRFLKKKRRNVSEYTNNRDRRRDTVNEIREALDYPNFNKIDLEKFYRIYALGRIIAVAKPAIQRNLKKFKQLLRMLCDETIPISTRYDNALTGPQRVWGVNEAFLSKILVMHDPKMYYVKNKRSNITLKKFGIVFPRGMSKGEKYSISCTLLQEVCKEAGIANNAVLDCYLYTESF